MSARLSHDARASGFSLLEMVVVLAILAMAAALIAPRAAAWRDDMRIEQAARDLATGLRAARAAAIHANREAVFVLDGVTGRYWSDVAPAPKALPKRVSAMDGVPRTIRFFPDGGTSGGTLRLSEANRIAVIQVDSLSGRTIVSVTR
jgi:general secretion pathway protein H